MATLRERINQWIQKLKDSIQVYQQRITESETYLNLTQSIQGLDPRIRTIMGLGLASIVLLILGSPLISLYSDVQTLKKTIKDQDDALSYLTDASERLRIYKIKSQSTLGQNDLFTPWTTWIDNQIQAARILKERVTTEGTENHFTLKLSQVNLRQITKILFQITEVGKPRRIQVEELLIDTKGSSNGYMDATLILSRL